MKKRILIQSLSVLTISLLSIFGFILESLGEGGRLAVNESKQPLVWSTEAPVPFNPDFESLGQRSNTGTVALEEEAFQAWEGSR